MTLMRVCIYGGTHLEETELGASAAIPEQVRTLADGRLRMEVNKHLAPATDPRRLAWASLEHSYLLGDPLSRRTSRGCPYPAIP